MAPSSAPDVLNDQHDPHEPCSKSINRIKTTDGINPTCSNKSSWTQGGVVLDRIRGEADLVLDGADGALLAPVEVVREAVGGEGGRVVRRSGGEQSPAGLAEAEELVPELVGGEVGELGDAVDRGGVEALVAARAAEVGAEYGEAVRVLVGVPVRLAEPADEAREVGLRVQVLPQLVVAPDHLLDEGVLFHPLRRDGSGGVEDEEDGGDEEDGAEASHDWLP